jgi:hypothetical protein
MIGRPMSGSENDLLSFLNLLIRSSNPEIPHKDSIAFFHAARPFPQALANCMHVLQNSESLGDAIRLLVYGFLNDLS